MTRVNPITHALLNAATAVERILSEVLDSRGVTQVEHQIMAALVAQISPISINLIAAQSGVTQPSASTAVNALEQSKLVEKVGGGKTARNRLIRLTPMGRALMAEIDQGVDVFVGHDPDAAAVAAVTAIRPAKRDELLAAKADTAIAAITGGDQDFCFVD